MCIYWRKQHTCDHLSDRPYIEMCKEGYVSRTVCTDIGQDDIPRKSYFPCWPCIRSEARAEAEAAKCEEQEAVVQAQQVREKQVAEQRAKEERIRREAREKAAREREEETRLKVIKEKEEERAKKEGGLWIETNSGKKQKHKKTASAYPLSAPPFVRSFNSQDRKESESAKNSPNKEGKAADTGGRAGYWGPKKILSRKENATIKK